MVQVAYQLPSLELEAVSKWIAQVMHLIPAAALLITATTNTRTVTETTPASSSTPAGRITIDPAGEALPITNDTSTMTEGGAATAAGSTTATLTTSNITRASTTATGKAAATAAIRTTAVIRTTVVKATTIEAVAADHRTSLGRLALSESTIRSLQASTRTRRGARSRRASRPRCSSPGRSVMKSRRGSWMCAREASRESSVPTRWREHP